MKFKGVSLPKATPVHFYRNGEKNEANIVGGFVARSHPNGILDIQLVSPHGGTVDVKQGVPHASDTRLVDPEFGRSNGCWDYHPFFVPDDAKRNDKAVEKIVELAETMSFEDVFKRVRSYGLNRDDVAELYEELGLESATADAT